MTYILNGTPDITGAAEILSAEALDFVEKLHHRFAATRTSLINARAGARATASASGTMDFLPETAHIRNGDWRVAEAPEALRDRRVEITGPATPAKMAINALNSGAKVWLADLEDAATPTWSNVIDALVNLGAAARGTLSYTSPEGKAYALRADASLATVVVRPRGWHLPESNLSVDGAPAVGALVDFGLHFFHNAVHLAATGQGPFYYLPKMESHLEARLWNEVFTFAESELGLVHGTIRATVLIETIPAAFEMDEILYELRDHASGLNAGRWDYLFSIIKTFREAGDKFIMPDRAAVAMTAPMMRAYTDLLVATCHKRGAFAMGGMAAVIPNRREPEVTEVAFAKVRADKTREANDGFDGSWVAHPDLVGICAEVFGSVLGNEPNQLSRQRPEVSVSADQLLDVASAPGQVTEAGVHANLYVAVAYTAAWLSGNGAVAIHNLMEDAATAEISRSQVWQQIRNRVVADDTGNVITAGLVEGILAEEIERLRAEIADEDRFARYYEPAAELIGRLVSGRDEDFEDFLTLPAYRLLSSELVAP
ncbi:malate synthase A [Paeniglutamicibacter cryotolerans]|uniref:Malate synthase n=1 Tax=Paeniglutamicibacter cryotolerans TaxID=670079 RepID=A0A839QE94_9MICC|nr:malate synthase A [Paeniglutamicibacter cryotolerans]MBB2994568.1 malate synthase [Paeniglutamicibacter cryotolerans]